MMADFKETEIGSIPSDWQLINLKQLGKFKKGKNIPKAAISQEGLPCILYGEIYTRYHEQANKLVSKIPQEYSKNSTEIQRGDILFAGSGETAEEIGKCFAYCGEEKGFAGGDVIIFTPDVVDPLYLGYLLNSYAVVKQKSVMGQGSSVFHIYPSGLEKIRIPLPPTKAEQTAIATALSDADALITSLERLIAKKKAIKQGALQELLKPRNGWDNKKLDNLAISIGSGKSKTQTNGSQFPIYGSTGVIGWTDKFDYEGKRILIARVGANAGAVNKVNGKYCVSDNTLILSFPQYLDINFIFYKLIAFQLNSIVFGSGQPLITGGQLKTLEIAFPKNRKEQTRIAQILSDMDAEITLLEKKLEKQKLIKQGMMQVLLTGKVRLL